MFTVPDYARPFVGDAVLTGLMVFGSILLAWVVL